MDIYIQHKMGKMGIMNWLLVELVFNGKVNNEVLILEICEFRRWRSLAS